MRASGAFYITFAKCRAYEARIMAWDVRGMLLRQHVTHAWDAHF
jgi:hypothetical protein